LGLAWDVQGNGKTVVRVGAGIIYEQLSLDVFNGVANTLGLRTIPTGANLYNAAGQQIASPGTISIQNTIFSGAALTGNSPGDIAYQWANNGPGAPIYSTAVPTCGTNATVGGLIFKPQPCSILGVIPNLRTPYVTNWNIDIQRALTNNLSLDVGYVGNHGTKLIGPIDLNQPAAYPVTVPGVNGGSPFVVGPGYTAAGLATCAATPTKANCAPNAALEQNARPYNTKFPYLSYVDQMSNVDVSNYDALQAVLTQRTSHGLSFTVGYTFSHALANASDSFGSGFKVPINSAFNRQLYTSTDFDIRQRLTVSGNYALPGKKSPGQILQGWALNAVATIQTGTPWGVADTSTDFSGTGELNNPGGSMGEQWNFFGNPPDFESIHGLTPTPSNTAGGIPYFPGTTNATCLAKSTLMGSLAVASLTNLGCFVQGNSVLVPPAYGSYGTLGRNIWRDQGFRNLDMSVTKAWKFKERLTAQFRAEFFNILNHPNFSNPWGGPNGGSGSGKVNPSSGAGFAFVPKTPDTRTANPVLGSGGSRAIQLGLKLSF
jgi:hypothetical protein